MSATVASVHIADVGAARALLALRGPGRIDGLRHADAAVAAPLSGDGRLAPPMPGRVGLVAFWDSPAALDTFTSDHPYGRRLAQGWHARLEALRAFGEWPGLDLDTSRARVTPEHEGPVLVATLGRLRLTQVRRFLRTSRAAEVAANAAPGFVWGTALARPPFVATVSLWRSATAAATYAYGGRDQPHPAAIAEDRRASFHHRMAFIRFRIVDHSGELTGRNPLPTAAADTSATP